MAKRSKTITVHPMAVFFPEMGKDEYSALLEDMRINGQREPITMHEGKILDGRNRYKACVELDIKPKTRRWDKTGTMIDFVKAMNLSRRHLTLEQRSFIAADLAKIAEKQAKTPSQSDASAGALATTNHLRDAAEASGVSVDSAERAAIVRKNAPAAMARAVLDQEIPLTIAAQAAMSLPTSSQMKALRRAQREGIKPAAALREEIAKIAPKPKPAKSGAEVVPVKLRKVAESLYGKLLRCMDKMGVSKRVDKQLDDILKAIRGK